MTGHDGVEKGREIGEPDEHHQSVRAVTELPDSVEAGWYMHQTEVYAYQVPRKKEKSNTIFVNRLLHYNFEEEPNNKHPTYSSTPSCDIQLNPPHSGEC